MLKQRYCLIVLIICLPTSNSKEIRLLGLLPMTGDSWNGGVSCLPAAKMAIEDVNNKVNVLADYNVTYKWIDTKCNEGIAVYKMVKSLDEDPTYHMVLGAGCSVESEGTSQVSYLWNLTQLSYSSSSPILSDRKRFPKFFRLTLPDQKHNPARIDLMNEFNWKKVATINQALEFFSSVMDDFVKSVQGTNITIISQEIFMHNPMTRVENLKTHDARIIMTAMYEDKARELLCAAYKVGLFGPKIVWVFVGWYSSTFWKVRLDNLECTEEEMSMAAEGAFITGPVYSNPVEERGIANLTAREFAERYYNHPAYTTEAKKYDFYAYQCYDHIWVAAMALDCANHRLKEMGNARQTVGLYRQDKNPKYFEWIEDAIKWKDNVLPRDSTYITYEEKEIPTALYLTMTSLASLGICLAISLFIFNVVHRHNSYVKMSSPNINNVLLLGCVVCYCTVFFKNAATENDVFCKIRLVCFSLGFTVTYGSLFSKTWRVYRIFKNKQLRKRIIKDYQLLAIIGGFVGLVSVVLIVWEIVGPYMIITKYLKNEVYMIGNDAEVRPFVRVCLSEYSDYFQWPLYVIEGGLLIFGAFLAWETKNVKIQALNDSHEIGFCIYNVVILSAVGLTLSLLLKDKEILMYGITSGFLIIGTLLTQTVIFVPKILAVKNKDTDKGSTDAVAISTGVNHASTYKTT
ncbi:gamma-aminobutyric acid type B receptor subunit 1-like isoform X2 [Mercenaria mercenaria]|uniref:gamma-aminobutyric acid type B receptor subunit 1-like isoform X2 n=1 Tax=Mercenaria mercenaria TaxID=6596 RepID=UPI00234F7781|nr:gamma-aminobutyric acid type B receptor subunit 1-like isoform X2 [Mercenaria mercenaria]